MKWNLTYANYNEETKISKVIIQTELGYFCGITKLHEEDKDIKSIFQGCSYAETRALIKYGRAKIKILKSKVETLEQLIKDMEKLKGYEKNGPEARFTRKQYFIKKNILEKWNNQVKQMENGLYNQMKNYRTEHENFIKKIKDEQEPVK